MCNNKTTTKWRSVEGVGTEQDNGENVWIKVFDIRKNAIIYFK